MAGYLLLALILVPLTEIAVFIEVGEALGLVPTLVIVVLTAVAGTALLRRQGLDTLRRAEASLARGEAPLVEVFDGVCLLLAGALLLTPGFVTDGVGFLLFLPPVRDTLRQFLARYVQASMAARSSSGGVGPAPARGPIIDGEFRDVTDAAPPERRPGQGKLPE